METQTQLNLLNLQREKSTILPTIAAFASYSKNAMRDEFNIFDPDEEWYPTTVVGVKINVPIFASGQRYSRISQKKMEYEKSVNSKDNVEKALQNQFIMAQNTFFVSADKFVIQKNNMALAKTIYQNTITKYKEGVASSFDLTNTQNQFLTAQSAYYSAIADLLNAKETLNTLSNN